MIDFEFELNYQPNTTFPKSITDKEMAYTIMRIQTDVKGKLDHRDTTVKAVPIKTSSILLTIKTAGTEGNKVREIVISVLKRLSVEKQITFYVSQ